jgi:hypothetical protein
VACYFIPRGSGFFSLSSLSLFLPLVLPSLGVFSLAVFSDVSSFCFVGALYVAWVFFTWVYLLLDFLSFFGLRRRDKRSEL